MGFRALAAEVMQTYMNDLLVYLNVWVVKDGILRGSPEDNLLLDVKYA